MSGILAVWHRDGAPTMEVEARAMAQAAAYRGRDGVAFWRDGSVTLGQQRMDVTAEDRAVALPLVRDEWVLVADARLDNRAALCGLLGMSSSVSDAELILAAHQRWENEAPVHLIGDFAYLVWNKKHQTLFAARDVMGARPLHYSHAGAMLCLATEAKQLVAHSRISAEISQDALWMWLQSDYEERLPMFRDVQAIPAGHRLIANQNGMNIEPYWDFGRVKTLVYSDPRDYFEHFRELFRDCVTDRCRTDGSVIGTMLSGGMDSTSVTAQAAATGHETWPFSYRFDTLKDCDESTFSETVAKRTGLSVNWVDCESFWIFKGDIGDQTRLENPFRCWDAMDKHILQRLANGGGKVLLTGHGGDNAMTGMGETSILAAALRRGKLTALGPFLRNLRKYGRSLPGGVAAYLIGPGLSPAPRRWLKQLAGRTTPIPSWVPKDSHDAFRAMDARLKTYPRVFRESDRQLAWEMMFPVASGIKRVIHWYDRVAAEYGIEVRHPFHDRRIAEFMLAIPQALVRHGGRPKGLLRHAMRGLLPDSVLWRDDKPTLASFYHMGIRNEIAGIRTLIRESRLADMGFVDRAALEREVDIYLNADPLNAVAEFWPVLITDMWLAAWR